MNWLYVQIITICDLSHDVGCLECNIITVFILVIAPNAIPHTKALCRKCGYSVLTEIVGHCWVVWAMLHLDTQLHVNSKYLNFLLVFFSIS